MRATVFARLLAMVLFLASVSCEEEVSEIPENGECYSARILVVSCGGTVLQFLSKAPIGEPWKKPYNPAIFQNCVNAAGNLPKERKVGDILYFTYKKVRHFTPGTGVYYCDIGGLPSTSIEVLQVYSDCQPGRYQ